MTKNYVIVLILLLSFILSGSINISFNFTGKVVITSTGTCIRTQISPTCCPDIDKSGSVNIKDLNILKANYGKSALAYDIMADINKDGTININDLNILKANYGKTTDCAMPPSCVDLIKTGDSSKNLDVVFIPYEFSNLEEFKLNLLEHINAILSVEPFKSRKDNINFHFIELENTHFPLYRYGEVDFTVTENLVNDCDDADEIIIMLKECLPDTCGHAFLGEHISVSLIGDIWETLHELGHAFGGLQDTYVGWMLFDGHPTFMNPTSAPNVDIAGCPKWCQSDTGVYQTACTIIIEEQECRHYERTLDTFYGKWECDDPLRCCVWLPEPDPFFGTRCVNFRGNKNIGIDCIGSSGCFYGANGQGAWRSVGRTQYGDGSTTDSIMNNDQREFWYFGDVEIRSMNKLFDCLYPQNCENFNHQECQNLATQYAAFRGYKNDMQCS